MLEKRDSMDQLEAVQQREHIHTRTFGYQTSSRRRFQFQECEIHKPNYHNQSRQQQPPHLRTRKQELAL